MTISADLSLDELTELEYKTVRPTIPKEALVAEIDGKHLVPGLSVKAFIKTSSRTVLSYVGKRVRDQIGHGLNER